MPILSSIANSIHKVPTAAPDEPAGAEHEFSCAFTHAAIGMALLDPQGHILRANRAFCSLLGFTEPQLRALGIEALVHEDDAAAELVARAELLAGKTDSYQGERRYLPRDGRVLWVHVACSLSRSASGAALRFVLQLHDIGERKRVEHTLRRSEERFRSLMMLSSDWYWEQDEQFRYVSSIGGGAGRGDDAPRPGANTGSGAQTVDSVGKCRWEQEGVFPLQGSWAGHRETLQAHLPFHDFEYMRITGDEAPRYVSVSGEPVFDAAGHFAGYRGTARDITEAKVSEKRLRETQSLLHMAAQIGRLGAWTYEVDDGCVTWSEEVCAIHEVSRGHRPTATRALEFYTRQYRQGMSQLFDNCLDQGTPFDVEAQIMTAKSRVLWVRVICEAEWDAQGKVRRLLGACQDITETKRAAEDAYAMAQQLTATLESLTDAFLTMDRNWRFTYLNAEAEHLLRRARGELLGRRVIEEFGHLKLSQFPVQLQRALEENISIQFDEYYPPLDLWLQVKAYPSRQGLAIYVKDISERTRAQNEILRLNAQLEERVRERTSQLQLANRELESFSYSIAHDLRAPLGSIDGFSRALEEAAGDTLGETSRHYLRRVRAGVRQMAELTDGLLALASLSQGDMMRQRVDLGDLAAAVAATLQEQSPARTVEVDIQGPLPVIGDPRLLHQVLANLLGNAWKFTKGQEQARIQVGALQRKGGAAFFVRDNGAGFDLAHASRLFQAFHRMHSRSEFEGNGIGLAIVQKIVVRHGGLVWAESSPGKGATFYFTLAPDVPVGP